MLLRASPRPTVLAIRGLLAFGMMLVGTREGESQACYTDRWVFSGSVTLGKGGPGCWHSPLLGVGIVDVGVCSSAPCNGSCPNASINADYYAGSIADGSYDWYSSYPGYMVSDPVPGVVCAPADPSECDTHFCNPPPFPPPGCTKCQGGFGITLYAIDERPEVRTCGQGPSPHIGKPINVMNGNVWFDQTDAVVQGVSGLGFVRSYNSLNAADNVSSSLGRGWSHSYGRGLIFPPATPKIIKLREDDGEVVYFEDEDSDLLFQALVPTSESSSLTKAGNTYTRNFRAGGSEVYDAQGRLLSVVDAAGNTTTLSRDGAGRLTSVTDPDPAP